MVASVMDGVVTADLLQRMADYAPAVMAIIDVPSLRVVYANGAARRAACGGHAEPAGRPVGDVLPFLDPAMLAAVARSGRTQQALQAWTGTAPWWDVSYTPLDPPGTGAASVLATAVDVSAHRMAGAEAQVARKAAAPARRDDGELQLAQSALRDSEQLLRTVLMQIPAAIFIVEAPDGRLAFTSRVVDEVLGNPDHDLAAARANLQGWAMHPDGMPYEIDEYPSRRALFNGETFQGEPMTYRRGDGRMIDLEIYAGPVRNQAGEIVAAIVAALDVTDRKDAAAKLRESEARLRVALEAGGLGTWEIDTVKNTTHFGRSLAVMLGLPPEPVTWSRTDALAFLHPDDRDRVSAEFAQALADGDTYRCEFRARKTDGSTRWFLSRGRIIRGADGSPLRAVGVIRDVTDRRLREERLREAVESRELLLREADHRIKNSLQLVGSLLALQRSRLSDPDAVAALDGAIARVMAVGEAHRALHQSVDLRHVALDQMLRDLCKHVGTLNPAVTFQCNCPVGVALDTERAIPLGLVISELLTNAAKHAYPSASGSVLVDVSLAAGIFDIVVSDRGVGMASPGAPRASLGSTIVRALLATIGAEIDVTSGPGQGTRTALRFPHKPRQASA